MLDNIELPIDITLLSTPSLLNNSPSESLRNTKTSSSDKSHIAKIENYIDQKFDFKTSEISNFKGNQKWSWSEY